MRVFRKRDKILKNRFVKRDNVMEIIDHILNKILLNP
jgi:hypothetical protein